MAASEPTRVDALEPGQGGEPVTRVAAVPRWLMRAGVFILPLAYLPNLVDGYVLPKLLLTRLLVILFGALLALRWMTTGRVTWKRTAIDLPLVAFIGSALLSSLFAFNRDVAIFGTYSRYEGLLTIVMYALLFWLAVQLLDGADDARALIWSLLISAFFVSVIAVLQSAFGYLGGGYFVQGQVIRADSTLANPDFLGIFLAMLIPVAVAKLISRRPPLIRLLAADLLILLALALLVSFTRSAWIGAASGVLVVLFLRRGRFHVRAAIVTLSLLAVGLAVIFTDLPGKLGARPGSLPLVGSVYARINSIGDLSTGSGIQRLVVWKDSLALIASRPLVGYGPDNFGLVYPPFQTANRNAVLWDKTHQDALQVAATQGLIGLFAYLWTLIAFVLAFWRGRYLHGGVALFGGWVGYQLANQANFSFIPTATAFWLFAAAAIVTWNPSPRIVYVGGTARRLWIPALAGIPVALLLIAAGIAAPYAADATYLSALTASASGDLAQARTTMKLARTLAPYESEYAGVAGDLALDLNQNDQPSADADWATARKAYEAAAGLGSFSPELFRHLAIVEEHFGDHASALAAARRAVELDRYDSISQKLLQQLSSA